jgi:3-methyladenine DNA glycosylase AlkC
MEPFKNVFNKDLIVDIATHIKRHCSEFDEKQFITTANKDLETLELKARSLQITNALYATLPQDFEKTGQLLLCSLGKPIEDEHIIGDITKEGISGWGIMPLAHLVGLYGLSHLNLSLKILKEMTKRFTAEFDIRFFLINHQEATLDMLDTWTADTSLHVRRLVSEGTRPRLPWAMQLPAFIKDPSPVLRLLEKLKDDDEEYVRRSVANNLNDIAKDHPDLVADIADLWMKDANKNRKRLVSHACRTLLKQGHKKALSVLGYNEAKLKNTELKILSPTVSMGGHFNFSLSLSSDSNKDQALMIDYVIHHQKANGTLTGKVFKWKKTTLPAQKSLTAIKKHPFKKISTRVYYPGSHRVEVMINGRSIGISEFELKQT